MLPILPTGEGALTTLVEVGAQRGAFDCCCLRLGFSLIPCFLVFNNVNSLPHILTTVIRVIPPGRLHHDNLEFLETSSQITLSFLDGCYNCHLDTTWIIREGGLLRDIWKHDGLWGIILVMLNGVGRSSLPPNVDSTTRRAPGLDGKERELSSKHAHIASVSTLRCVTNETGCFKPCCSDFPLQDGW